MKVIVIVIFIIIAILAILAGIYIHLYNKLQKNIIRVNEAESEIDETLRKRYDILRDLEDIINDNTKVTQENFKDFDKESAVETVLKNAGLTWYKQTDFLNDENLFQTTYESEVIING